MAAPSGLSSQEALQRLLERLTVLINRHVSIQWFQEAKKNPCRVFSSCLVVVAGLLLVVQFSTSPENHSSGLILFQAVFLFFLAALNLSFLGWEIYTMRSQKVRHLLSKLGPMDLYPWTAADYPRSPISTLRGHLTIPAYRDNTLVNVPINLLVHGDVIELDPGTHSPANAVTLDDRGCKGKHISVNQVLSEDFIISKDVREESDSSFSFLRKDSRVQLVVEEAPILSYLESILKKERTPSLLTRDVGFMMCVVDMVLVVVYSVALVWNIMRYFALKREFDNSWPEMLFGIPVYTSLPLLMFHFPLVWLLMNLYGTSRIALLVDGGPLYFQAGDWKTKMRNFLRTLWMMGRLMRWCTHYPHYKTFHTLGTLTSVCAVDTEYLLTSGFPSPEKVFFLRTENVPDEAAPPVNARTPNLASKKSQDSDDHIHHESVESPKLNDVEFHVGAKTEKETGKGEEMKGSYSDTLDVHTTMSQPDSLSVTSASDPTPFELVMDALDISPAHHTYSGISFDNVNWQSDIGSLKPIGVNLLATSHLMTCPFYFSPLDSYRELQLHLHKSSCVCALSIEIGVKDYFASSFLKHVLICSVSSLDGDSQHRSTATIVSSNNPSLPPHIISTLIREVDTQKNLIMSRGSGSMIASCCSDFWDGKDLQPMTDTERMSIVNYYNSRSLSSYCVALSYRPLLDINISDIPREVAIYITPSELEKNYSNVSITSADKPCTAEQIFKSIQCNQVFLGLVSLQFRPKQDIVTLIEDLYTTGIRFVHFTAENELRAKIFAQKLGLEADWNCFISLAPSELGEGRSIPDEEEECSVTSQQSSLASSILSIYNAAKSNIVAKLPKGINNIRPHIEKVDNVPLLVSLFTDCTTDTITSMIEIMQENSEVILCIGNAWNHDNMSIFSQADISLSLIPQYIDFPTCTVAETCALSNSNSSQMNSSTISHSKACPSPLEVASYLNCTSCQLCFGRESDVSLPSLIWESRRLLMMVCLSLTYGLGASLAIAVLMLLSSLLFLPPPLSGGHLFWFFTVPIPLIMLSFLGTPLDPRTKTLLPIKKMNPFSDKGLILLEMCLFSFTGLYGLALFLLTLREICISDIPNSTCHALLGDRSSNNSGSWNGWRGNSEQGLLFAQDFVAFFMMVYLVSLSIRYIHRTRPLWALRRFISLQYVAATVGSVFLQLLYFIVSQSVNGLELKVISGPDSVPVLVWCLGFLWPLVAVFMAEVLKHMDKKKFKKAQTLLKLQFETKLGMHSPVA